MLRITNMATIQNFEVMLCTLNRVGIVYRAYDFYYYYYYYYLSLPLYRIITIAHLKKKNMFLGCIIMLQLFCGHSIWYK
jgi:hypothetical protein